MKFIRSINIIFFTLLFTFQAIGQEKERIPLVSLHMPDTIHKARLWVSASTGTVIVTGFTVALWNAWYKNFEQSSFHLFDDRGEWEDMDKVGHFMTAYNQARWMKNGARWTGIKEKKSVVIGGLIAFGLQGTVEVFDGFSEKWGFSIADVGMNTLGASFYVAQELVWKEQRINMKMSSYLRSYSDDIITSTDGLHTTTLQNRARNLYGTKFAEAFIKDYNAQTYWASVNVRSFLKNKNSKFPKWLNVAVGYGAENMYAGFDYEFTGEEGGVYALSPEEYPRYRQGFLSLDIDFTRIPTKNRGLQTIFGILNFLKFPSPTLEFNKIDGIKFHAIYW